MQATLQDFAVELPLMLFFGTKNNKHIFAVPEYCMLPSGEMSGDLRNFNMDLHLVYLIGTASPF